MLEGDPEGVDRDHLRAEGGAAPVIRYGVKVLKVHRVIRIRSVTMWLRMEGRMMSRKPDTGGPRPPPPPPDTREAASLRPRRTATSRKRFPARC